MSAYNVFQELVAHEIAGIPNLSTTIASEETDRIVGVLWETFVDQVSQLKGGHVDPSLSHTYVTVNAAVTEGLHNAVIMYRPERSDEYSIKRVSVALSKVAAKALARSWASAGGWEIR